MENLDQHEIICSNSSLQKKTHELVLERRRMEYSEKARILKFKLRKSEYSRGIEDQARTTSMQVTKLKRFKAKTRVQLYKQLVLPIIEYPPVDPKVD